MTRPSPGAQQCAMRKMVALNTIVRGVGGRQETVPSGTEIELPDPEARDLFACGAAEPATWPTILNKAPVGVPGRQFGPSIQKDELAMIKAGRDDGREAHRRLAEWLEGSAEGCGLAPLLSEPDPAVAFAHLFSRSSPLDREMRTRLWDVVPNALEDRDAKLGYQRREQLTRFGRERGTDRSRESAAEWAPWVRYAEELRRQRPSLSKRRAAELTGRKATEQGKTLPGTIDTLRRKLS